ncbi:MAG: response regulator [Bacteriovoracaceae bacterium]|jgi:CheY-like chemotaxis protein|nr:response regulator [Bacteriovoracaceae bacterium]
MNVLIIEDEILIQQSLKKLLEKFDINVDTATQGKEAINLLKTNKYERVVCDLMLKDITGFDIIEEMKSIFTNNQISNIFIIITAYSSEQVIEKAKKYNCLILNKPFEDIRSAINTIIEGKKDE